MFDPNFGTPPHTKHIKVWAYGAILEQGYPDAAMRAADIVRCEKIARAYVEQDEDAAQTIAVELVAASRY